MASLSVLDLTDEITSLRVSSTFQAQTSQCDKVRRALEEHGYFFVEYKTISADVGNTMLSGMKKLFKLPLDTKKQIHSRDSPLTSYYGQQAVSPLHEAIGIIQGTSLESIQNFTNFMLPENGNSAFSQSVYELSDIMQNMGLVVTQMMLRSYQLPDKYETLRDEQMNPTPRFMYYRVPTPDDASHCTIGIPRHVDKTFITTLHQIQAGGLEVEARDGKWISVDHPPSSFIVIAGEALQAWTNGRIDPPWHRVNMANQDEDRYSFGIFTSLRGLIKAPDEMVDEKHPLLFNPYIYEDFMKKYEKRDQPNGVALSLKAFCGRGTAKAGNES